MFAGHSLHPNDSGRGECTSDAMEVVLAETLVGSFESEAGN